MILALKRSKHRIKESIFELHANFYHTSCLPVIPFPFRSLGDVGYACRRCNWTIGFQILSWKSYWTYLSLMSLSCRIKIIEVPIHGVIIRIKREDQTKTLSLRDGYTVSAQLNLVVIISFWKWCLCFLPHAERYWIVCSWCGKYLESGWLGSEAWTALNSCVFLGKSMTSLDSISFIYKGKINSQLEWLRVRHCNHYYLIILDSVWNIIMPNNAFNPPDLVVFMCQLLTGILKVFLHGVNCLYPLTFLLKSSYLASKLTRGVLDKRFCL